MIAIIVIVFLGGPLLAVYWAYGVDRRRDADKAQRAHAARRQAEEEAELQRERASREEALLRRRNEQRAIRKQMIVLGEESLSHFESAPKHLRSAVQFLDQAESDFHEGVFAPFWDSIERAAHALGRFDESIQSMNSTSLRYTGLVARYDTIPPIFPLSSQSISRLSVSSASVERMTMVVRRAQKDFHFATIYEQRKTNQILVAGFTSLAHALDQLTSQITNSIGDLASSVDAIGVSLNDSILTNDSHLQRAEVAAAERHGAAMQEGSERAAREVKALEMLDNIQRHRAPWP